MNEAQQWHVDTLGARVVDALTKNNFKAIYVKTRAEAVERVLAMIPAGATVGMNCQGPSRICNVTTIIRKKPSLVDFHVVIIGEDLGF